MAKRRRFGQIRKLPSGSYQASFISPVTGKRVNAPNMLYLTVFLWHMPGRSTSSA